MTELALLLVVLIEAATIVALVTVLVRQQNSLFRAAMSRTPGEFRKLEQAAQRPAPQPKPMIDEATALVLESVTSSDDSVARMPHGLGGD